MCDDADAMESRIALDTLFCIYKTDKIAVQSAEH